MVEAVGFPPQQEAGIKGLLKSLTYDAQADLAATLAIGVYPHGECQCGCGELTAPYPSSRARTGAVKGQPQRFIKGHRPPPSISYDLDEDTGCWLWRGALDANGYGHLGHKGHSETLAHRYMYAVNVGPITADLTLHHACHNRACINPQHLSPVDRTIHAELTRDRYATEVCHNVAALAREALTAWEHDQDARVEAILETLASLENRAMLVDN